MRILLGVKECSSRFLERLTVDDIEPDESTTMPILRPPLDATVAPQVEPSAMTVPAKNSEKPTKLLMLTISEDDKF